MNDMTSENRAASRQKKDWTMTMKHSVLPCLCTCLLLQLSALG